ncbi:hypothetical protein AAG906_022307 [Vitis piasezkii]
MESNLTPSSGQDSTTNSQSTRNYKRWGIHRMKQHLAGVKGDIGPCKSVPPDVRFRMENSLQEFVNSKKATQEAYEERNPYGPNVSQFEGDMAEGEEEVQEMQSPMAASSGKRKKSTTDKYFVPRNTQGAQPSMRSVLAGKEATWRADMAVGRFFYDACIPTNAVNSFYFKPMLDAIPQLNTHQLPCVLSEGISFVKSVDASDIVKDASNLFLLFDEVIEWVGPLNVVHIVTDNAANYVAAGRLISQKHKHINWSPCAAHCLNLIFKDIGKMNHVAELVRRASKVTIFVYNHVALLSWLRKRKMDEILRLGATRFATTFIALKSLHDHKHDLQALVTSKFFVDSRYSKDNKSKVVVSIILDNRFWNDCLIVVNLMSPLMRLLRIVDCDERPSMGYVYEGMYRVQNFCNKPTVIGGVMDVIDQKVLKGKLETMNEMKLFRDRLGSFGRDLAYSSREVLQPDEWWRLHGYNAPHLQKLAIQILSQTASSSGCERNWSKRIYDPIDYACIDETDFWIVDDNQPAKLDVEELETLLYEEGSIPINEVEGSSSHVDNEDGGDVAIEGLDVENFGFPDAYFQSP